MINIIIADDKVILREGLRNVIEQEPELKVVAEAGNGKEAYKLCCEYMPDVVLMEIKMPEYSGIEGTRLIKSQYDSIKVLMLTSFEDESYISKALEFGAEGYMLKDIQPEMLRVAIKSVYSGIPVIHKNVLAVLKKNIKTVDNNGKNSKETDIIFSKKELEIINLISKGKSNSDIAKEVLLSKGRVANIITNIFEKTGISDRTELAVFAIKNNIV